MGRGPYRTARKPKPAGKPGQLIAPASSVASNDTRIMTVAQAQEIARLKFEIRQHHHAVTGYILSIPLSLISPVFVDFILGKIPYSRLLSLSGYFQYVYEQLCELVVERDVLALSRTFIPQLNALVARLPAGIKSMLRVEGANESYWYLYASTARYLIECVRPHDPVLSESLSVAVAESRQLLIRRCTLNTVEAAIVIGGMSSVLISYMTRSYLANWWRPPELSAVIDDDQHSYNSAETRLQALREINKTVRRGERLLFWGSFTCSLAASVLYFTLDYYYPSPLLVVLTMLGMPANGTIAFEAGAHFVGRIVSFFKRHETAEFCLGRFKQLLAPLKLDEKHFSTCSGESQDLAHATLHCDFRTLVDHSVGLGVEYWLLQVHHILMQAGVISVQDGNTSLAVRADFRCQQTATVHEQLGKIVALSKRFSYFQGYIQTMKERDIDVRVALEFDKRGLLIDSWEGYCRGAVQNFKRHFIDTLFGEGSLLTEKGSEGEVYFSARGLRAGVNMGNIKSVLEVCLQPVAELASIQALSAMELEHLPVPLPEHVVPEETVQSLPKRRHQVSIDESVPRPPGAISKHIRWNQARVEFDSSRSPDRAVNRVVPIKDRFAPMRRFILLNLTLDEAVKFGISPDVFFHFMAILERATMVPAQGHVGIVRCSPPQRFPRFGGGFFDATLKVKALGGKYGDARFGLALVEQADEGEALYEIAGFSPHAHK